MEMDRPSTTQSLHSPQTRSFSRGRGSIDQRRPSLANFTNEVFLDDDPSEDWTRTTSAKDSWAHRERRRSSMWQKIDSYPTLQGDAGEAPERDQRRGSILSLFQPGKDRKGRDILHSEGTDGDREVPPSPERDGKSAASSPGGRRGSILSMWTWGKDKSGKDVIHSGFDASD